MKVSEIKNIRRVIVAFIILLAISGITAFPLVTEVVWMKQHLDLFPEFFHKWILKVHDSVINTPDVMLYGTDWLAFAHLIIGLFFIGVYQNPVRNKFIIDVGIIACLAVLPLAFICGTIRGIPFYHQIIDCCFGLFGLIPLYFIKSKINYLEKYYSYQEYEHYRQDLNAL